MAATDRRFNRSVTLWCENRAMLRPITVVAVALAVSACAAQDTPQYVIRLDLEQIAAQTATRQAAPGFELLGRDGPAPGGVTRTPLGEIAQGQHLNARAIAEPPGSAGPEMLTNP